MIAPSRASHCSIVHEMGSSLGLIIQCNFGRKALNSRASVSGSDGGLAEPAKPPVHADQNLVDALVHIFDEELAIGENECFVPIPETHLGISFLSIEPRLCSTLA